MTAFYPSYHRQTMQFIVCGASEVAQLMEGCIAGVLILVNAYHASSLSGGQRSRPSRFSIGSAMSGVTPLSL